MTDDKRRNEKATRTIEVKRVRSGIRAGAGQGYECDDHYGPCGTPMTSGGGCGCGGGGATLLD